MKFRKIKLLLLAAAMLITSCTPNITDDSQTDSAENTETEEFTRPNVLTHVFRAEKLQLPEGYFVNEGVTPVYDAENGKIQCIAYSDDEVPASNNAENTVIVRHEHVLTLAEDGTVLSDTVVPFEKSVTEIKNGVFTDSGMICVTYLREDDEYAIVRLSGEDYTADKTEKLNPLFESTATIFSDKITISDMAVDQDGSVWICAMSELLCLSGNFIRMFSIQPGNVMNGDFFESVAVSGNGKVYAGGTIGYKDSLFEVNKETRSLGQPVDFDGSFEADSVRFGEGFDLYFRNAVGLYGLNLDDGSSSLVMNFNNSDTNSPDVLSIVSPEAFFSSDGGSLLLYKKSDDVDLGDTVVLELASTFSLSPLYTHAVSRFNRENSGVRIMVTEYVSDSGDAELMQERLVMDMLTGRYEPDIIVTAGSIVSEQVIENEIYADLYPLIDSDDIVTRDNLFDCVEEAFDDNGKMWGITHEFMVSSVLGTQETLGGRESWTFDEMLDFALSLPSDTEFFDLLDQDKAKKVLLGTSGYNYFIDYENGSCSFDSPEFIRLLEYLKTLPERYDYTGIDQNYDNNIYREYHGGSIALKEVSIFGPADWLGFEADFNTKDYTLIGYPVNDTGKTAYINAKQQMIITSFSDHPEEAWEFVKSIVTREPDPDLSEGMKMIIFDTMNLPVLETILDSEAEDEYYKKLYTFYFAGSTGASVYSPDTPFPELREPGIQLLYTPEAHEEFKEFLDENAGGRIADSMNEEIAAIIADEISAFNAGLRDAESTANMIQSRVSLWLAENS